MIVNSTFHFLIGFWFSYCYKKGRCYKKFQRFPQSLATGIKSMALFNVVCVTHLLEYFKPSCESRITSLMQECLNVMQTPSNTSLTTEEDTFGRFIAEDDILWQIKNNGWEEDNRIVIWFGIFYNSRGSFRVWHDSTL